MSNRQIQEAVQQLAGKQLKDEVYIAEVQVTSVNIGARTCACTSVDGLAVSDFQDVQLMNGVDDGILVIPTAGSNIIIGYSKRLLPFVLLFAQIDQVIIITGSSSVTLKDGTIQLNDGSYGGLIKIDSLITKINNLENLVNDLITKYNAHTHILTLTAGTGTAAPTVTVEGSTISPVTQKSDLENTNTTHGQ